MRADLLLDRADFIAHARPSVGYCSAAGIDWSATEPATGGLFLASIETEPRRRFRFVENGVEAAVIEVRASDGETVSDLVAWPTNDPDCVLTLQGTAVLGEAIAANPATFFQGRPLRLFRRPFDWLLARCDGAVILDLNRAARWLIDVDANLVAQDRRHGAEIEKALLKAAGLGRILVPRRAREAA